MERQPSAGRSPPWIDGVDPAASLARPDLGQTVTRNLRLEESEMRMDSTVHAIANGNGSGIGQRLIGLQPPLSPPPPAAAASSVPRPAMAPPPAPTPVPVGSAAPQPAPAAPTPSTENLLVRFGLLSTEQLDEALVEQRGSGKHVAQIAVERGWVTREQLTQLVAGQTAPEPAPEPTLELAPDPEPAPELEPAAEATPEPTPEPAPAQPEQPALQTVARVYARLTTGERIQVASFPELAEARQRAEAIVRDLSAERPEWPCFAGRFVRPEAIVSVDVEATLD